MIGTRISSRWSPVHRFRLVGLLETSLAAVVLSLIPLILLSAGVRDSTSWLVTSLVWLAYMAMMLCVRVPGAILLVREHPGEADRRFMPIIVIGLATTIGLQVANVIVLHAGWPHLVAILWSLIVGFIFFVRLLFRIWEA